MTEHRILKYKIPVQDEYHFELPVGSEILSVAEQHNEIVVYALVAVTDEDMSKRKVDIHVIGTGHYIKKSIKEYKFLGTVNLYNGRLMFHVFYR
jgi:hypothetical protein